MKMRQKLSFRSQSKRRALRLESLEGRRLLAVVTVDDSGGADYVTIQAAIDAANAGDEIHVEAGNYTENITIDKNLALVSTSGRASTQIEGISGIGSLGTILVTGNTTDVKIGDVGQGFTIIGIDNGSPGIENAAIYIRGDHSGAEILDNEVVANGDHGLLAEYGAKVSGWIIDGNEFSGQTFVGPQAGGIGFSQQFSLPNVPRQLVTMGNGGGSVTTANVTGLTFSNNDVTGIAGGISSVDGTSQQGNTLVTLDVADSTISGNTFAGTTTRWGSALRVRRPDTSIVNNTFDSSNMLLGTTQLYVENSSTGLDDVVAVNSFDRGAYTDGGSTVSVSISGGVGRASVGETVVVLAGSYSEDVSVDKSLTIRGANAGISAGVQSNGRGAESELVGGFRLLADNVTIDGMEIKDGVGPAGIGDLTAVYFAGGTSGHVIQNSILTGGGTGRGILSTFNGSNDSITIEGNDIGHWTAGVFNQGNSSVDILCNSIHDNVAGVANDFVDDVLIKGNDFENNDEAIGTFQSTDLTVSQNDLDGNDVSVAHYGGDAVDAVFNWWGSTDPNVIAASIRSDGTLGDASKVNFEPFLLDSAFSGNNQIFQGVGGQTLVVNADTGDFYFTDGNGNVSSGTGAKFKNGKLKLHAQDDQGRKIDVKGDASGQVEVVVKYKGKQPKESFTLELFSESIC